ncbi:hypothetical protein [Pelagerythrobacter marensis]|uniref:Uncharacterized protein n=1 Tax=Pelagerythrobacter marensis TaxID=543877 RepID=A0A0G3X9M8_9SPHN|nr:hypothetical protein [Pelagerythrobacter marensis]AKM08255.1 hypothetical protein AM2010_2196 [Pelagerythrobacter marensis]
MKSLFAATLLAGFVLGPAAALAQGQEQDLSDDVRMSVVYGEDAAPDCPENEICVVARLPESERYRIPESLRFSDDPANVAWTRRVESLEMIGDFGTLSCSTAGAGGFTGCTQQLIEQAYGERATSPNVRFSELIAAARAERLSTIDDAAAAEQERVEQIEREYMERLERERTAPLPDEENPAIRPSQTGEPVMEPGPQQTPEPEG